MDPYLKFEKKDILARKESKEITAAKTHLRRKTFQQQRSPKKHKTVHQKSSPNQKETQPKLFQTQSTSRFEKYYQMLNQKIHVNQNSYWNTNSNSQMYTQLNSQQPYQRIKAVAGINSVSVNLMSKFGDMNTNVASSSSNLNLPTATSLNTSSTDTHVNYDSSEGNNNKSM